MDEATIATLPPDEQRLARDYTVRLTINEAIRTLAEFHQFGWVDKSTHSKRLRVGRLHVTGVKSPFWGYTDSGLFRWEDVDLNKFNDYTFEINGKPIPFDTILYSKRPLKAIAAENTPVFTGELPSFVNNHFSSGGASSILASSAAAGGGASSILASSAAGGAGGGASSILASPAAAGGGAYAALQSTNLEHYTLRIRPHQAINDRLYKYDTGRGYVLGIFRNNRLYVAGEVIVLAADAVLFTVPLYPEEDLRNYTKTIAAADATENSLYRITTEMGDNIVGKAIGIRISVDGQSAPVYSHGLIIGRDTPMVTLMPSNIIFGLDNSTGTGNNTGFPLTAAELNNKITPGGLNNRVQAAAAGLATTAGGHRRHRNRKSTRRQKQKKRRSTRK